MQFARIKPTATNQASPVIDVGAVIIRDDQGRVLMAERTARQKSGGFWEIPGGKLEGAETPAQAALRELTEETGLTAEPSSLRPFSVHVHVFETRTIRVHFFTTCRWQGVPQGREGQKLDWVDPGKPHVGPLLPSNFRALTLLALPMLVERAGLGGRAARPGAATLIDAPALTPVQRQMLARRNRSHTAFGGLWLAGGPAEAAMVDADVQLGCVGAPPPAATPARQCLWAVPCNSAIDLTRAEKAGADLAVLRVPRGADGRLDWGSFAQCVANAGIPVWADGASGAEDLDHAIAAGAAGLCTGQSAPS